MRFRLVLPALVAALLLFATTGVVHRLSTLGDADASIVDLIVAGNVHSFFVDGETWQAAVEGCLVLDSWTMPLRLEVWLAMAALLGGVFALLRRGGRERSATLAWACMATTVLPWLVCWWMVRRVESPSDVGPWVARMLGCLMLGCAAALVVVARSTFAGRAAVAAGGSALEPHCASQ